MPTLTIGKIGYFPVKEMKRERNGTKKRVGVEERLSVEKCRLFGIITRKPSARVTGKLVGHTFHPSTGKGNGAAQRDSVLKYNNNYTASVPYPR